MGQRLQAYLAAIGVPLWQRREPPASKPEPSSSTAAAKPPPGAVAKPEPPAAAEPEPATDLPPLSAYDASDLFLDEDGASGLDLGPTVDPRAQTISTLGWDGLRQAVEQCQACPLHQSRTRAVFGVGNQNARWMIIGEAPGADEDRLGEPFVGRAGKLLDRMLTAMALTRDDVYITNILKSRPPRNRDPEPAEMRACWPFLVRQIELVKPTLIVAMGRIAAQSLLETKTPVGKLRGQLHRFQGPGVELPLIVTYHPAYLLRSPREKRKSWDDLRLALRTERELNQ